MYVCTVLKILTYQYPLRFLFFSLYSHLFWCTDFSISCIQNWLPGFAAQHSVNLENVLESKSNLRKAADVDLTWLIL